MSSWKGPERTLEGSLKDLGRMLPSCVLSYCLHFLQGCNSLPCFTDFSLLATSQRVISARCYVPSIVCQLQGCISTYLNKHRPTVTRARGRQMWAVTKTRLREHRSPPDLTFPSDKHLELLCPAGISLCLPLPLLLYFFIQAGNVGAAEPGEEEVVWRPL